MRNNNNNLLSINTAEFHNYLQENQIDSLILKEAFDSENEGEKVEKEEKEDEKHFDHFLSENSRIIKNNIDLLCKLINEETDMVSHFLNLSRETDSKNKLLDLFEAMHYELLMRYKDKQKAISLILL